MSHLNEILSLILKTNVYSLKLFLIRKLELISASTLVTFYESLKIFQ